MKKRELVAWWRWFSESECRGYSPLYESISNAICASDELHDRLLARSNHVRQPNMLLAAMHDLVLRGEAPELAAHYNSPASPLAGAGDLFVETALHRWDELVPVLEARRTQTNEVGRVSVLAPALAAVVADEPTTLIDVGTSAGLTLTLPHCRIDYGDRGTLGPADSPVCVDCEILGGDPPIRPAAITRRIGLDRRPLDPNDPADARWLLACTWPDTGRLERTRAALDLAAAHPSELRTGDAVTDLPALLAELEGPIVVTTTWALAYLPDHARAAFVNVLSAGSVGRPLRWVSCEAPGVVDGLPEIDPPDVEGISASVVGSTVFRDGIITERRALGHAHPHGHWIWWHQ
mgnify:CR=1 FL=1